MADILVVGSSMYDLITYTERMPKGGETLAGDNFKQGFGGKGANQAIAAAKLGGSVAMLTAIGDDSFGVMTAQNYQDHHIDMRFIHKIEGQPNGVATIVVDGAGQNRIIIVKGANDYISKEHVDDAFAQLKDIKMVVLQLEISLDIVYYTIQKAKQHNIAVLLNPAPAIDHLDMALIGQLDFFVPNETELEILTKMPVSTAEETEKAAAYLIGKGVKNIIVTLGEKGALYMDKDSYFYIKAPQVNAIDTTGAGDSFIGAFVSQYTQHNRIKEAIEYAIAYASLSTTAKGTQSAYLSKEEFEKQKK